MIWQYKKTFLLVTIAVLSVFFATGYVWYSFYLQGSDLALSKTEFEQMRQTAKVLSLKNAELSKTLSLAENDNSNLQGALSSEKSRNDEFASQIAAIGNTVQTLDTLSKTDKELLRKYSRVYFLNENYIPSSLGIIDPQYVLAKDKLLQFHTKAYPFLKNMMDVASTTGTLLFIVSAYRSFGEQSALKSAYKMSYGSGANSFSADQGYSEHQLGTTIDLTSQKLGGLSISFGDSTQGKWLAENAYKYGFILSYPKQNTYYQYEPWHWRFVGTDLATKLHNNNQYFYDLPEREINSYLISIFN